MGSYKDLTGHSIIFWQAESSVHMIPGKEEGSESIEVFFFFFLLLFCEREKVGLFCFAVFFISFSMNNKKSVISFSLFYIVTRIFMNVFV